VAGLTRFGKRLRQARDDLLGRGQLMRYGLLRCAELLGDPARSISTTKSAARRIRAVQTHAYGSAGDIDGTHRGVLQASGQALPGCQPSVAFSHGSPFCQSRGSRVSDGVARPAEPAWHTDLP
jgi:hypothetical protein